MTFPTAPDSLSTEWLSQVLGQPVESFSVKPLGEGVGILGLVTRVNLVGEGCPKTLIAKFQSPVVENRAVACTYDMYEREVAFYRDIAPTLTVRSPQCYHVDYDPASRAFIILLEDLQGYAIGDQVAGCSERECEQIVRTLARFHAETFETQAFETIQPHNSEAQVNGMQQGFTAGWPVVQTLFPELITPQAKAVAMRLPDALPKLLSDITRAPVCISHGDLRLDNVFFADDHIALVDFQAISKSAPEHDLAYFLTQSPSDQVRNARDWVALYHEELSLCGVTYDIELSRARYRQCALYFLCYAVVICSALDLANERGKRLGETLLGNALRSIAELDAFDLLT